MNLIDFVVQGEFGDRLSIPSEWRPEYGAFMRENNIAELMLNSAHGFVGRDLGFLRTLPFLVALDVLSYEVDDLSPIESLRHLRALNIGLSGSNSPDFRQLTSLEKLFIQWRARSQSLFECTSLANLYISHFPDKTVMRLANLTNLKKLRISNSPVSDLADLAKLGSLRMLGLYYCRTLSSLHGIEALSQMEELDIDACKRIERLDEVAGLTNLRKLSFKNCGEIASLQPLRRLNQLVEIHFWESTNILDGDLSYLKELPSLTNVSFRNRKHYTLTRGQLDSSWNEA